MSLVVMATGGTGGHIYPAVATARELVLRGHTALLLGQRGGMEERVAREQDLEFVGVDAGKLARSGQGRPDPRELLRAAKGVLEARRVLQQRRPGVVVGYGGFASLPGVLAAQSLRIPTVLHEQNARLGLTQRLAVRQARAIGTAYETVIGLDPARATLVGMPVREDRLDRAEALRRLKLREGPLTIFVMGGSQGSLFLNNTVPDTLRHVLGSEGLLDTTGAGGSTRVSETGLQLPAIDLDFVHGTHAAPGTGGAAVQVLHSTGPRWLPEVAPGVKDLEWYHPVGYVDAVAAWSVADLAITRAGTSTLAEAAYHGVPLVMVPLPESSENHQFHNGKSVEAAGAGVVVEQREAQGTLGPAVLECAEPRRRAAMQAAARARAQVGAASRFADLIETQLPGPQAG